MNSVSMLNYHEQITDLSEDKKFVLNWFRGQGKLTVKEAVEMLIKYYPQRDYTYEYLQPRISELVRDKYLIADGTVEHKIMRRKKTRLIRENRYKFNAFLTDEEPGLFG